MSTGKLSWEEIKKLYDQEWVELVDYDWPEGTPLPRAGVVRVHERDRQKFHALVKTQIPAGSALVFVGTPKRGQEIVYNNLFRVDPCN